MTNSVTPTKQVNPASGDLPPVTPLASKLATPVPLSVVLGLIAAGWLGIFYANRWYFGAPVFFLWAGWLSVVLMVRYLWTAAVSAALDTDDGTSTEDFWKPIGRRDELELEKRSLLKAIKEIEFDHQMGKMSNDDANQLTSLYRRRAIEVIKALEESQHSGQELSIADRIEQEVKARLAVSGAENKATMTAARKKDSKASAGDRASVPDKAEEEAGDSASVPDKAEEKTADSASARDRVEATAEDAAGAADEKADKAASEVDA